MGKQHQTFPGEPSEMPETQRQPEIEQPHDPAVPEIPQEDPDNLPDELPPDEIPGKDKEPGFNG